MYRKIVTEFWSDPEVEELGANAKYVLLYLMTTPLGNTAGCFTITTKRIAKDTELEIGAVESAFEDILDTNIAEYSRETCEVLLKQWPKHNWNMTPNLAKALEKSINAVKHDKFREYLQCEFDKRRTSIEQASNKPKTNIEQTPVTVSVSVTDSNTASKSTSNTSQVETGKHKHGTFSNVLLTDYELEQLKSRFQDWQKRIDDLSYYIGSTGKSYTSHYRTILSWARNDEKAKPKTLKEVARERYSEYIR